IKPEGSITLGGEVIPLGGAFGRSVSTLTIADNDVNHGVFNFNSVQYMTNENAVYAVITVIRTNGSVGAASVDYFTRDSTALAGIDYVPILPGEGKLTFQSGVTSLSF